MKLLEKAINLINIKEGVGEVPPQVPSPGNVSYYQSVDETLKLSPERMRDRLVKQFEKTGAEEREVDAYREELRLASDEEVKIDYEEMF